MKPESVIKGAIFSEKAAGMTASNVFGIKVDLKASKDDIRAALKDVFGVDAVQVRTLIRRGDENRRVRSKGSTSFVDVKKPNLKKAYVTLREGQTLPVPVLGAPDGASAE
jgi:large subunit ribosomal protein L23